VKNVLDVVRLNDILDVDLSEIAADKIDQITSSVAGLEFSDYILKVRNIPRDKIYLQLLRHSHYG
jgi:hypothetical protein